MRDDRGRFVEGTRDEIVGEANPSWRGGRSDNGSGYIRIRVGKRYVYEHRHVMEQMLGRPLESWEQVHHRNKDRSDNRPENLELTTLQDHGHIHRGERVAVACTICGAALEVQPNTARRQRYFSCGPECRGKITAMVKPWEARWGKKN